MSQAQISPNSIVCCSREAVATEVNDEVILMSLERDRCYGLGDTGSEIWRRMREPIAVSALLAQLEDLYESSPGAIEADLLRTLAQFAEEGLIDVLSAKN